MEEYYGSNREYLQDCFQLVKMIERKANEASRGPVPATKKPEESDKPEQADPIEELRGRISRKAAESIRRKISIPLEELVKKHKLSEDERKILMILTYGESMCSTEYQDPKRMLNLLTLGKTEEAIKYWHYFKIDSGLYRKKIILMLPNDLAYRCYFIRIRPDKLLKILGEKSGKKPARKKTRQKLPSVSGLRQIYSGLNRYVVGQDYAKRMISVALYQHLKRIKLNEERKPADRIDKSNILIIGPTGVGKTFLCRMLANTLKLPIAFCDATQYTESGYVGADVEEMLVRLVKSAENNIRMAERGIVYIDEVDKLVRRNPGGGHFAGNKDVSGESVQQELLKLLDGEMIHYNGRHFLSPSVAMNVRNVLFIAGGAFDGLEDIIRKRMSGKRIGFETPDSSGALAEGSLLRHITTEDLINYGFTPEFVGRFHTIVPMESLTKEELVNILTEPRNAIVKQYVELFKASDIDLEIPRQALELIAEQALKRKSGARGLRAIMENLLSPMLFERMDKASQNQGKIVLEKEIVEGIAARMEEKAG